MVIQLTWRVTSPTLAAYPELITKRVTSSSLQNFRSQKTVTPYLALLPAEIARFTHTVFDETVESSFSETSRSHDDYTRRKQYARLCSSNPPCQFPGKCSALPECITLRSSDFPPRRWTSRQPPWPAEHFLKQSHLLMAVS